MEVIDVKYVKIFNTLPTLVQMLVVIFLGAILVTTASIAISSRRTKVRVLNSVLFIASVIGIILFVLFVTKDSDYIASKEITIRGDSISKEILDDYVIQEQHGDTYIFVPREGRLIK